MKAMRTNAIHMGIVVLCIHDMKLCLIFVSLNVYMGLVI